MHGEGCAACTKPTFWVEVLPCAAQRECSGEQWAGGAAEWQQAEMDGGANVHLLGGFRGVAQQEGKRSSGANQRPPGAAAASRRARARRPRPSAALRPLAPPPSLTSRRPGDARGGRGSRRVWLRGVGGRPASPSGMKRAEAAEEAAPGCGGGGGGGGAAPVSGFLAKLWALVEDSGSDAVICWSRNGQNFSILDEQRFAKELLPKYFKHNNLSSFIRQLNIYGFRKVIALENGMMTSAKNSAIEFQHPFFKREKFSLLANIKRKVSAVRAEELKVCPEDLHRVLSEVQEMREQQSNMDLKLASMKRENEALWKEVASLRQKHSQQQQLLSKILEFILSLMRRNCIVGLKRKRSLSDGSGALPAKYGRQYIHIPIEDCETATISEHPAGCEDALIIRDITNVPEEEEGPGDCPGRPLAVARTVSGNWGGQLPAGEGLPPCRALGLELLEVSRPVQLVGSAVEGSVEESCAVEPHSVQPGVAEDPAAVIASILDESQAAAQSGPVLEREEMQDFLNCIDASLEELQAMLSGKKLGHGSETLPDRYSPELVLDGNLTEVPADLEGMEYLPENADTVEIDRQQTSGKKDMQLIQYRGNPLLSLLEDAPSSEEVACKIESASDVLLASLEDGPPSPLPSGGGVAAQQFRDPAADGPGPEPHEPPLLPEDVNGEYKLFPLLLLSPVANFIEEASEIKPPEPDRGLLGTAPSPL
ncbi:PREDICTED: heat shock factor protein 3-like [Gekko japonicus]|uniref:Heat shock factor protein 3-like n=1 Tax=Gekko japonicus TaxID=146911 RepID=A0ABM1KYN7_GEKJA|nr:PREDICTED: heat shock factor protein 3-like [Gekko japonicus]